MESFPVDGRAIDPEIAQGGKHGEEIGVLFAGAGQGRENPLSRFLAAAVAGEGGEGFAGADFEEEISGFGLQDFQAIAEPDGLAEVARPVGGVGGFLVGQPCAGHIGDERNLRAMQLFLRGPDSTKESRMGSMAAEWKAWEVSKRCEAMPCALIAPSGRRWRRWGRR